jgi:murein DD-endopeptidase MepM/ murein hydrolase activator NlpD
VHGPIVARFGAQCDGLHNSGIAIAVAKNTPIRSAEDGVVIYAGSGLKSFGNLALVRHADNYVTAYGHAKELAVKRGDQVKRGDIIGRSGQTGQASTPRVHFGIRKDSVPRRSDAAAEAQQRIAIARDRTLRAEEPLSLAPFGVTFATILARLGSFGTTRPWRRAVSRNLKIYF